MNVATTTREKPRQPWRCPECGSDNMIVYYSERRSCLVTTIPNNEEDPQPWPSFEADEFWDFDEKSFNFVCNVCDEGHIKPTQEVKP